MGTVPLIEDLKSFKKYNIKECTIALSLKTLEKIKSDIGKKLYLDIKERIEILKLFLAYREHNPISYIHATYDSISFQHQFNKIILPELMNGIPKIYKDTGVDMKYIINEICIRFTKNSKTEPTKYINKTKLNMCVLKNCTVNNPTV
jgi:hypothetical protein